MKKRVLSILLVLCLLVGCLPLAASAAYSSNWLYWSQGDSAQSAMQSGCRVVAYSKLLSEAGIADSSFNPDVFYGWMKNNGYISGTISEVGTPGTAMIKYAASKGVTITRGPTVALSNKTADERKRLVQEKINQGYYVVLVCASHTTYVARGLSLSAGIPVISESGKSLKGGSTHNYDGVGSGKAYDYNYVNAYTFDVSGIPIDSTIRISGETVPGDIKHGSKFGVRGIISSGAPLTSVTGGVFTAANCGGTRLTGTTVSPNATSYNLSGAVNNAIVFNTLPVGTYWYCVSATNSGGTTVLINQQFSVLGESRPAAPGTPTVSVSNSKVTVSWNDVANETSYNVYLVQEPWGWEDIRYRATVEANATSYTFTDVDPGDYAAFVISMPNDANIQSGWAWFSVSAPAPIPTNCKVVTDKQEYTVGDTVTITPSASNAVGYAVSVRKREDTSIIVWSHFDAFTGSVTYTPTKAGEYVVWANALNADGKSNTEGMACDFTVQEKTPTPVNVKVITDKAVYQQGETVTITPSASNVSGFTLSVREGSSLGAIVFSEWDKFTGPVTFTPTNAGKYVVVISVFDLAGRDVTASDIPNPTCSFEVVAEEDTPDTPLDPTPENSFIDVPNGAYYAKSVNWAVDRGITAGTTQTTFSPNQPCTRAQAVTFLWRAAGSPKPQGSNTKFTDVTAGHYYTDAVQWAVENGITGGTTPTTFSPNDKCTRAQIVCFLHRFHHSPAPAGVSPFTDVPVSVYYSSSVAWAVENGITSGISSTQFGPFNDCSRGQIVTFLYRDMAG